MIICRVITGLLKTIIKKYEVYADGKKVLEVEGNRQRLCRHSLDVTAKKIELRLVETWGSKQKRIFAVDLY